MYMMIVFCSPFSLDTFWVVPIPIDERGLGTDDVRVGLFHEFQWNDTE